MKIIDTNGQKITQTYLDEFEKVLEQEKESAKQKGKIYFALYSFWNSSFCGYRTGHTLTHPWIMLDRAKDEIKWAWQRVFRGWDDRVVWSIDHYLAKNIPNWIEELKRKKQGIPMRMFDPTCYDENYRPSQIGEMEAEARWDAILDNISEGFKAYLELDNLSWKDQAESEQQKKFNYAFELLKENFCDLWD